MKKYIYITFVALFTTLASIAQVDRSKQPIPGPAPTVKLTTPQTFELDNGMKVMVVVNKKLPRVRVELMIDNPMLAFENKKGVENLFASVIGNGTKNISKEAFNEEIDFLGASVYFGSEGAYASTLSKYFPRVIELMADAIANPLFTEEEFQLQKDRYLESLKNNKKDVSTIAQRVSRSLLYGKQHPKGEFVTEETAANVSLADVQNYYQSYFSPENAYLVVLGDVKFKDVKKLVNEHFSNWFRRSVSRISYSTPQNSPFTQINFVDMPNAVQSEIIFENVINLKMSDPDYHAALIANHILGGGGTQTKLNKSLRETHGWTYGSYSGTGADKNVTRFLATASVRNEVTDSAVTEMVKIIYDMRNNKVSTQDLANAKAKYVGDFVRALEKLETVADYALNIETQNLPNDFYETYLKKINAVTVDDVQRVAQKYYLTDNARIIVVGKGADVIEGLKKVTNPEGKHIPTFYFDIYGNKTKEPVAKIEMDPSVTIETVFDNYIKAIGGKENVDKVKTVHIKASGIVQGMPLNLESKVTNTNKSSEQITMNGMVLQKTVFNGSTGYSSAQGQKTVLDDKQVEALKKGAYPFPELKNSSATLKGIENVDGKHAYVVADGENSKTYYDVESGLKVKTAITQKTNGMDVVSTTLYSDYKEVNGVKFPHKITILIGPQEINFNVSETIINEGVTDADFE